MAHSYPRLETATVDWSRSVNSQLNDALPSFRGSPLYCPRGSDCPRRVQRALRVGDGVAGCRMTLSRGDSCALDHSSYG